MATKTRYLKSDFIYTHCKKHLCPTCGMPLRVCKAAKTVTPTANYDGLEFDSVKLVFKEFECTVCNSRFSIDEIKQYEGASKKESRK